MIWWIILAVYVMGFLASCVIETLNSVRLYRLARRHTIIDWRFYLQEVVMGLANATVWFAFIPSSIWLVRSHYHYFKRGY